MTNPRIIRFSIVLCLATSLTGCRTIYFGMMERFGFEKRDLLIDRVEDARDGQDAAKQQFASALEEFSKVLGFEGGDLETKYNKLNSEYRRCETRAQAVRSRIDDVEYVAKALFKEWKSENKLYTNEAYRRSSERQLDAAQERYETLIGAMHRAEDRMDPVLDAFRDQVLFLKHNLNSRAIASLQDQLVTVETNIEALVRDMEASIAEANVFIEAMIAAEQSISLSALTVPPTASRVSVRELSLCMVLGKALPIPPLSHRVVGPLRGISWSSEAAFLRRGPIAGHRRTGPCQ